MSDLKNVLSKYAAETPREVLRKMAEVHRQQAQDGKIPGPEVTVYTSEGHSFSGLILDFNGQSDSLLLYAPVNPKAASNDVVYLAISRVAAVRVRHSEVVAPVLSDGKVARPPGQQAPSRLEVRRLMREIAGKIKEASRVGLSIDADWDHVPDDGSAMLNLQDLVQALPPIVASTARDSEGRAAWARVSALHFEHRASALLSARKDGKTVVVDADLGRALPGPLEKTLTDQLNAVL